MDGIESYQSLDSGMATNVGCVRKINEDSGFLRPDWGLWAVADGMGGHQHGDWASQAVVGELGQLGRPVSVQDQRARILHRLWRAHRRIAAHAEEAGVGHVGSTAVVLGVFGGWLSCVWSGDSRCYRIREEAIVQVNRDHTQVQAMLDRGQITPEEARHWPRRNVITRAVGIGDDPRSEVVVEKILPGDLYLLCSDGLTEHLSDDAIRDTVLSRLSMRVSVQGICEALIEETLEAGAKDNVTVVMVRFLAAPVLRTLAMGEDEVTHG